MEWDGLVRCGERGREDEPERDFGGRGRGPFGRRGMSPARLGRFVDGEDGFPRSLRVPSLLLRLRVVDGCEGLQLVCEVLSGRFR